MHMEQQIVFTWVNKGLTNAHVLGETSSSLHTIDVMI